MVDLQHVRFTLNGYRYRYPLPPVAAYRLASFESGDVVEPFSFSLRDGTVYLSKGNDHKPGGPAAIRAWAKEQGLTVPSNKHITPEVKAAYAAAHPGVRIASSSHSGQPGAMTRKARSQIQADRFYGLKLATGFQPGGVPG